MHAEDAEIVGQALEGDRGAFDLLVRRYSPHVFKIVYRFFPDRQLTEDIAQDVFLSAYTALGTYGRKRPFKNWLTAITIHRCYREMRNRQHRKEYAASDYLSEDRALLDELYCSPGGKAAGNHPEKSFLLRDLVDRLLQRLTPRQRMVLVLTEVEGLSVQEVAALMGISGASVRIINYRARKQARSALSAMAHVKKTRNPREVSHA